MFPSPLTGFATSVPLIVGCAALMLVGATLGPTD